MAKKDFSSLMIKLASPTDIIGWSSWEITSPDTVNYRTWKSKEWWLFCEKIFWPIKNYECSCGKHKWVRYKWVICDKCWVEVASSRVRRERMWHIELQAPVLHVWYYKSTPSVAGGVLNLSAKEIEKILNFVKYIVVDVNEKQKENIVQNLDKTYQNRMNLIEKEYKQEIERINGEKLSASDKKKNLETLDKLKKENEENLKKEYSDMKSRLNTLKQYSTISEVEYRTIFYMYEGAFNFKSWVNAIEHLLESFDIEKEIDKLKEDIKVSKWKKKQDIFKRLQLLINLHVSWVEPKWAILRNLPVVPADLRPIVQLDGGKFASSDINVFYRRVLMRNTRLKKMIDAGMPDVVKRNEERLLQESVNNLIVGEKNQRSSGAGVKVYKSLTDILVGKEWRFRKNLLWKRVDYSGRSVITVWPDLKLDECWVPLYIAVKIFGPFIISKLLRLKYVHTPKQAEKLIKEEDPIALEILREVIKDKYVMLNRAPTLHRLWIQAFKVKLMPWKTIRIHPLVCTAFNADFDGDQMWLHLPLSKAAQKEAKELIASDKNILRPGSGEPIITHTQDMVLWVYYLTDDQTVWPEIIWTYASIEDVIKSHNSGNIKVKDRIMLQHNWEAINTIVGRVLFNSLLPESLRFNNSKVNKKALKYLLDDVYEAAGREETVRMSDILKDYGFKYATISSVTMNVFDLKVPAIKQELLEAWDEKVKIIHNRWYKGHTTEREKHRAIVSVWTNIKQEIEWKIKELYKPGNDVFVLIDSGARWDWSQLTQLSGMKWLVANPKWEIIELPIKSALVEWFSPIEYFIAAHGARKGKADTALKTAESGYLTRRLVDATQDMIIKEAECGVNDGMLIVKDEVLAKWSDMFEVAYGRILQDALVDENGELLLEAGTMIEKKHKKVFDVEIESMKIRSPLTCATAWWSCAQCYGMDLSTRRLVDIGTPVWVISSQSIWEPGTQLTMRTFHTWWVASAQWDITQGIKRVEELLEVRTPKIPAVISPFDGVMELVESGNYIKLRILGEEQKKPYLMKDGYTVCVKKWENLKKWSAYAIKWRSQLKVQEVCKVLEVSKSKVIVWIVEVSEKEVPSGFDIKISGGDEVFKGQILTWWPIDIKEYRIIVGDLEAQKYIIDGVKTVYSSQWQALNEKYIEIIVKQLFSKIIIEDSWDTWFIPGNVIKYEKFAKMNKELELQWKTPAKWQRQVLWLTQIAKQTDSWLSSASFQETMRVLVSASVKWDIDMLEDLKSNVIIWRKLPIWEEYRRINGALVEENNKNIKKLEKNNEKLEENEEKVEEKTVVETDVSEKE